MPNYNFIKSVILQETNSATLNVSYGDLEPVISVRNISDHYGVLYRKYLEDTEDDPSNTFAEAGALLHSLFFSQLQAVSSDSTQGASKQFLVDKFGGFVPFKHHFITEALKIQGSGWCYLDTAGNIETISNHEIVSDVVLIIDMWEHAYYQDYGPDKEDYLNNI